MTYVEFVTIETFIHNINNISSLINFLPLQLEPTPTLVAYNFPFQEFISSI